MVSRDLLLGFANSRFSCRPWLEWVYNTLPRSYYNRNTGQPGTLVECRCSEADMISKLDLGE